MPPLIIHLSDICLKDHIGNKRKAFIGLPWKYINLKVHFSVEVLVLFRILDTHILELFLYIASIDS